MEKATLTFEDGTQVEAEINGTCYIVDKNPDIEQYIKSVKVKENDGERTLNNVEMIEAASVDGRYWFTFCEITTQEMAALKMQSDIDYLAMMAGVEL
jgi:hypothetical protein